MKTLQRYYIYLTYARAADILPTKMLTFADFCLLSLCAHAHLPSKLCTNQQRVLSPSGIA